MYTHTLPCRSRHRSSRVSSSQSNISTASSIPTRLSQGVRVKISTSVAGVLHLQPSTLRQSDRNSEIAAHCSRTGTSPWFFLFLVAPRPREQSCGRGGFQVETQSSTVVDSQRSTCVQVPIYMCNNYALDCCSATVRPQGTRDPSHSQRSHLLPKYGTPIDWLVIFIAPRRAQKACTAVRNTTSCVSQVKRQPVPICTCRYRPRS